MLHTFEDTTNVEESIFNEKRETFMQIFSQYLNGVETKFGFSLFEAIINLNGEDHLQDSFFVFRK